MLLLLAIPKEYFVVSAENFFCKCCFKKRRKNTRSGRPAGRLGPLFKPFGASSYSLWTSCLKSAFFKAGKIRLTCQPVNRFEANSPRTIFKFIFLSKNEANPASFCLFLSFSLDKCSTNLTINDKALMVSLGLKPGVEGW